MTALLSYALCTVEDVKELMGLDAGNTSQDNLIRRKINQATEMIEKFCDRRFALTTYTDEEYDGSGTTSLILRQRPITALTSVSERTTTENLTQWDSINSSFYYYDANSGIVDAIFSFNPGVNRYKVTYTAGYSTIPSDLAEACATLAAYLVTNPTSGTGIKSKTEGQRKVEYFDLSLTQSKSLLEQLNLDDILRSYANNPVYDAR